MSTATLRLPSPMSAAPADAAPAKKSRFARLYNALMEARMRAAMREIAMRPHLVPEDVRKDLGALPFVRGA
jgi:hypothetical protein